MMSFDSTAFDRWLTTEPVETCIHAGIECANRECACDCSRCEQTKAGRLYDPSWGGTEVSERGTIHFTDAVSAYPELRMQAERADYEADQMDMVEDGLMPRESITKIVITVDAKIAKEITEWLATHPRMLLCSTVPALHHWTINRESIEIRTTGKDGKDNG